MVLIRTLPISGSPRSAYPVQSFMNSLHPYQVFFNNSARSLPAAGCTGTCSWGCCSCRNREGCSSTSGRFEYEFATTETQLPTSSRQQQAQQQAQHAGLSSLPSNSLTDRAGLSRKTSSSGSYGDRSSSLGSYGDRASSLGSYGDLHSLSSETPVADSRSRGGYRFTEMKISHQDAPTPLDVTAPSISAEYSFYDHAPFAGSNCTSPPPMQTLRVSKSFLNLQDAEKHGEGCLRPIPFTSSTAASQKLGAHPHEESAHTSDVSVFVMLPLDTVNSDGIFRYATQPWFLQSLQMVASSGAKGVAVDIWWGAVEQEAKRYKWTGYQQLFKLVKSTGLKLQVVLSFHACGGNVGDSTQIPLPAWVLQAGDADPELFYADRVQENGCRGRNKEYISAWSDDEPAVLAGRSPMQCYEDFMVAFRDTFADYVGSVIEEVVVGAGPCGELRFPSYVESNGWRFPGIGEFQCYDRRALRSLAKAAHRAGHPEWGYTGPHDAGHYNSKPDEVGFFCTNGSWDTPYGRFFLEWYSSSLLQHGERLLSIASKVFKKVVTSTPPQETLHDKVAGASCPAVEENFPEKMEGVESSPPRSEKHTPRERNTEAAAVSPPAKLTARAGTQPPANLNIPDPMVSSPEDHDLELEVEPSDVSLSSAVDLATPSDLRSGFWNSKGNTAVGDSADCTTTSRFDTCTSASSFSTDGNFTTSDETEGHAPYMEEGDVAFMSRNASVYDLSASTDAQRKAPNSSEQPSPSTSEASPSPSNSVNLILKVAGIHWWHRSRSHAAELTAGYYNTSERNGYEPIVQLCAKYGARITLTCVEMCDAQHPPRFLCGPEGLLRQIRSTCAAHNVLLSGENALPIFHRDAADAIALERVFQNVKPFTPGIAPTSRSLSAPGFVGLNTCSPTRTMSNNIVATNRSLTDACRVMSPSNKGYRDPHVNFYTQQSVEWPNLFDGMDVPLPPLHSFTFLRLGQHLLNPTHTNLWVQFMNKVHGISATPPNRCTAPKTAQYA